MIGERIKYIRNINKLKQTEFCERVCITQSYLSRIESGKENPTDMLIKLISFEFNVSLAWLSGETDSLRIEDSYDMYARNNVEGHRDMKNRDLEILTNVLIGIDDPTINLSVSCILGLLSELLDSTGLTNYQRNSFKKLSISKKILITENISKLVISLTELVDMMGSIPDNKYSTIRPIEQMHKNDIIEAIDDIIYLSNNILNDN